MLSEKLQAFADGLAEYRDTGMHAAPEAVETFVTILSSFARDAVALESTVIPDAARRLVQAERQPERGNVILLASIPRRPRRRADPPSSGGGDAA